MQVIPRWSNVLIPKTSSLILQSSASFHSTHVSCGKWKNKWDSDFGRSQQPSKNYFKYTTRQKRADAKRALKDMLFHGRCSKISFQRFFPELNGTTNQNGEQEDHRGSSDTKSRSKSSANHRTQRSNYRRMKRKIRQASYEDDFYGHPETAFEAIFGNRWFNSSFKMWKEFYFQNSNMEFDWDECSSWTKGKRTEWRNVSDVESDDETCVVGSSSDRSMLGLPSKGPIKIEDVKKAFRLSALKWHPDKHQASSQAEAEEKFKHCVDAYKSLCNALA